MIFVLLHKNRIKKRKEFEMAWFSKKEECVHCRKNKTRRDFENMPTCADCRLKILIEREPERFCPVDGAKMEKSVSGEIIIDRCPKCNGVWLDAGELETIKQIASDEGMGNGVAIGMVIG
jgi:hypothetical protein